MNSCLRTSLKALAQRLSFVLMLPIFVVYKIQRMLTGKAEVIASYSELLALFPGQIGAYLRSAFYCMALKNCSKDCYIGFGTVFSTAEVEIQSAVYIGKYCCIGSVSIATNTRIASRVSLLSGLRQHQRDAEGQFMSESTKEMITIGSSCWIGEAAVVAANVGSGSNIAAGAVVLREIGESVSVFGNPARAVSAAEH